MPLTPRQQDALLRVADLLRDELHASGRALALVARAGLDLRRFGLGDSHAGIALRDSPGGAWAVRQLYYACDERRPRLFDQGLAGFVAGLDDPARGHFTVLLLPEGEAADALATAALDTPGALALLGGRYSAIAYPWSTRYQNCNQWLAELIASAWDRSPIEPGADARRRAQRWLHGAGYRPQPVPVGSHLRMAAASFMPLLPLDDHPPDDRFALRLHVSMPASIERFVQARLPGSMRLEICHDERRAVLRRAGPPLGEVCEAAPGDRVLDLAD